MDWLYIGLLFLVFAATVAMMIGEGFWSNTLTLVNIVIAGLFAFGLYGPIVVWIDDMTDGEWTYGLDFVCLWLLFFLIAGLMRLVTDMLSRVRLRFRAPVEWAGGILTAVLTGWILMGFVGASMHTAPLAKDFLNGAILVEEDSWDSPLRADLQWLKFVGRQFTTTSFSSEVIFSELPDVTAQENPQFVLSYSGGASETVPLDADLSDGQKWARYFVARYAYRRAQFDANGAHLRVDRGAAPAP